MDKAAAYAKKYNSQNLIYQEPRLMLVTRIVGFGFAMLLSAMETLVKLGVLSGSNYQSWAYWPTVIGLVSVGLLQALPLTRTRVTIWLSCFTVFGFIISVSIFGFSTMIYLGWLVLIMVMAIMVHVNFAWFGYAVMLASVGLWLGMTNQFSTGPIIANTVYVAAVGLIVLITGAIWQLASRSIVKLNISREQESLERRRLTTLINDMVDGVVAVDGHGQIRQYNAAALNILDINGAITGKPIADYLKPHDHTGLPVNIERYLAKLTRADVRTDLKLTYGDGSEVSLYLAAAPVRLGYGRSHHDGYTLILRDITREKSVEEERNEFISVVSHELRTPIAIAEGNISNVQFVLANAKSKNRSELVNKSIDEAHQQVLFLADMINDLSTLSRAERGKLEVEVETIDVNAFLDELLDNYLPDAKAKGLRLSLKHNPRTPALNSSKLYVREVLQNFITNAIKYTEEGGIVIAAAGRPGGVEFSVSDTGIGMSKADKERVFDKFFRSEDFRTRKTNGTGLGLYVTMKLARLLNAEINVDSQLNHGSTFTIFFPDLKAPKAKTAEPEPARVAS